MIKEIKTTGEILRKYINESNLTQKEIADEFKMTRSYLSEILNNKKPPSSDFLEKFKNKFGLTIDDEYNVRLYDKFKKIDPEWQQIIFELINNSNKTLEKEERYKNYLKFERFFKDIIIDEFSK